MISARMSLWGVITVHTGGGISEACGDGGFGTSIGVFFALGS